jgi:hypothetical protein
MGMAFMTTRTRRRILIATIVVVGIVVGGWYLSRPSLDPRFVGTWRVGDWRYVTTLEGNGNVIADVCGPTGHRIGSRKAKWWVSGGKLHELQLSGTHLQNLRKTLLYRIGLGDAVKSDGIYWSCEIIDVTNSEIRLRTPTTTLVLHRVIQ